MIAVEAGPAQCTHLQNVVATSAAQNTASAGPPQVDPQRTEAWKRVVEEDLVEWGRHPEEAEEDGAVPPTLVAIKTAIQVAQRFGAVGAPEPHHTYWDCEGGITFEREDGEWLVRLVITASGAMDFVSFFHSKLVERKSVFAPDA